MTSTTSQQSCRCKCHEDGDLYCPDCMDDVAHLAGDLKKALFDE